MTSFSLDAPTADDRALECWFDSRASGYLVREIDPARNLFRVTHKAFATAQDAVLAVKKDHVCVWGPWEAWQR